MMTKSADIWVAWAIRNKRSIFFFENKVLDLTEFAFSHPGGKKSLENFKYKDITSSLFKVFPHDRLPTLQRLQRYYIGRVRVQPDRNEEEKTCLLKPKGQQSSKKKVCFQKKHSAERIEYFNSEQSTSFQKSPSDWNHISQADYNQNTGFLKKKLAQDTKMVEISIELMLALTELQNLVQTKPTGINDMEEEENWFDLQFDSEELQQNKKQLCFRELVIKEKQIL